MIGLVLEGGANRTIFTSGVTDAMIENNIKTDYLIGVSAGIAYGVNYASWQKGRILEIFNKYNGDKRYMHPKHMLRRDNRSIFDLKFVYDTIPNKLVPFDYETFKNFPGDVEAVVTNLITGDPEYIKVTHEDKEFKALIASCALPLLFPPIYLDGKPYMDGGLSDAIPYKRALDKGCDKVVVVLTREQEYLRGAEKYRGLLKLRYRKYPELLELLEKRAEIYNEDRKELFELEKEGKALIIMPDTTKDFSRIEKDMDKINLMYNNGYNKTIDRIGEIKEFCKPLSAYFN